MRFAGSDISFEPPTLASAGKGSNAAAAAGAVDLNDTFGAMREKAPKYDALSAAAMDTQSKEKIAGWNAQAQIGSAGLQSIGQTTATGVSAYGQMRSAEIQAEAQKDAANKQMIGSIAGAALGMFSFSDERCKHNIEELNDGLALLKKLRPVTFFYKDEFTVGHRQEQQIGFIAQEYQKVLPQATAVEENSGYLCIDQNQLIGVLVKAVQQLDARITALHGED